MARRRYVVKSGDTWQSIARKLSTNPFALATANRDKRTLRAGVSLNLPAQIQFPTPNTTAPPSVGFGGYQGGYSAPTPTQAPTPVPTQVAPRYQPNIPVPAARIAKEYTNAPPPQPRVAAPASTDPNNTDEIDLMNLTQEQAAYLGIDYKEYLANKDTLTKSSEYSDPGNFKKGTQYEPGFSPSKGYVEHRPASGYAAIDVATNALAALDRIKAGNYPQAITLNPESNMYFEALGISDSSFARYLVEIGYKQVGPWTFLLQPGSQGSAAGTLGTPRQYSPTQAAYMATEESGAKARMGEASLAQSLYNQQGELRLRGVKGELPDVFLAIMDRLRSGTLTQKDREYLRSDRGKKYLNLLAKKTQKGHYSLAKTPTYSPSASGYGRNLPSQAVEYTTQRLPTPFTYPSQAAGVSNFGFAGPYNNYYGAGSAANSSPTGRYYPSSIGLVSWRI